MADYQLPRLSTQDFAEGPDKPVPQSTRRAAPTPVSFKIPEEFSDSPRLRLFWKRGHGQLNLNDQEVFNKALEAGKLKLTPDEWSTLDKFASIPRLEGPSLVPHENLDPIREAIRDSTVGLMATAGGVLGMPMGPGGVITGGALGAAGGSALFDTVNNVTNKVYDMMFGGESDFMPAGTIASRAVKEGIMDGLFSTVFAGLAPPVMRAIRGRVLGMTPRSVETLESGRRIGARVLPAQVSANKAVPIAVNVLGRLPWIAGPLKKAGVAQINELRSFLDTLPGRISPRTPTDPALGIKLDVNVQNKFDADLASLVSRQNRLKEIALKAGAVIPTREMTAVAKRWLREFENRTVNVADKQTLKVIQGIADFGGNFMISLKRWDDDVVKGLQNELDRLGREGGEGSAALTQLLEAARNDLLGSRNRTVRSQASMDKAWEAFFSKYESIAAKKFTLVDRARFREGIQKIGTRNPDELVSLVIGSKSPQFVNDIRGIVGNDAMKDLAARYIDRGINSARFIDDLNNPKIDVDDFAKAFGVDDPKSATYAVTQSMLNGTGVSMQMLKDFVDVARAADSVQIPNVSTFLARRVVLSGLAKGLDVLVGAMGPKHFVSGLVLTLFARHGAKILSNPVHIRLATTALKSDTDKALGRTAALRLARLVLGGEESGESLPEAFDFSSPPGAATPRRTPGMAPFSAKPVIP